VKFRLSVAVAGVVVLGLLATLNAACSGESGAEANAPEGVSDKEYLAVLCGGLEQFSDALIANDGADELQKVIQAYIGQLQAVTPPRDVSKFHAEYIKFLTEAKAEPMLLAAGEPPLPPAKVRQRFTNEQRDVAECKSPTFFTASDVTPESS
jgi:hypothetical protein